MAAIDNTRQAALSSLPSVDELMQYPECRQAQRTLPRALIVDAIRRTIADARQAILRHSGDHPPELPSDDEWRQRISAALALVSRQMLTPVINATGVVLHTNLGRAPMSEAAIAAVTEVCRGYSNLEFDLQSGSRGLRDLHGEELLKALTGAEAALVVNNNAAAVLLALAATSANKEVIVSRGELIEIGGSFRIPDVIAQSGCILVEVGTTNRTHLRDYASRIGPETAALLKVHTSNYKIIGFTHAVSAKELAELAERSGILLIEDLGSGVTVNTDAYGLAHEPTLQEVVQSGAHLITCSGDKLLGGPQAGIILGRRDLVERCRRHPLARALRVDKMTLAALQATLIHYLTGEIQQVPIWGMIGADPSVLKNRAERLCARIENELAGSASCAVRAVETVATIGGGSLPGETIKSWAVQIRSDVTPQWLAGQLRQWNPPIVGRIEEDALLIDLRTVSPEDEETCLRAIVAVLSTLRK